jgi:DNA-binding response OmpR family regulator
VTTLTKALVFVVEDDRDISQLVRHHLEQNEFTARVFSASTQVLEAAQQQPPKLFLLDVMLPGGSGLDLCSAIRKSSLLQTIPLIFLTAKTEEADRVLGLEMGADDYITKPFSPRELVARVRALLRRYEKVAGSECVRAGEIMIDPAAMVITVRGEAIETTGTEFRLLHHLATHPRRVFTRDQLLDAVWSDARFVTPRSVDVYIRRLREKVERDAENPQYLRTVRGTGYRFEAPK